MMKGEMQVDVKHLGRRMRAIKEILGELNEAQEKFPRFNSAHEGLAVVLEEFDELKAEVWKSPRKRDIEAMRKEAVQVAAMALRFVLDVCDEDAEGMPAGFVDNDPDGGHACEELAMAGGEKTEGGESR